VVTVPPDMPLDQAVGMMRLHSVRRLPVLQQGRAVGIISLGDLAIERDETSALADISAAEGNA
jgi:CBS domain-containing protein